MKPLRSTLVLLFLAALIGGYIYWNERGEAPDEGSVVLLRATRSEVQNIQFSPSKLTLIREGENWRVQSAGKSAPADPEEIYALLSSLELVQSDAPIENAERLQEYGLEKPASSVTVNGKTLEFGTKPAFDATRIYAKSGNQVALLPTKLSEEMGKSFEAWRDRAVLRFDNTKVDHFSFSSPQLKAEFRKDGEDWKLEKPLQSFADTDAVTGFLSALSGAETKRWLDESGANSKKWGLDTPTSRIQIGDSILEIGSKQTGGYAARNSTSNAIFLLEDSTFAAFNRPLRDWRDKRVFSLDANAVTSLEITARGRTKVLVKTGDSWAAQGAQANTTARNSALDLIDFILQLRAQNFVDNNPNLAQFGLDKPLLRLNIQADPNVNLRFGRSGKGLFVQQVPDTGTLGTIFVLKGTELDALTPALEELLPVLKK